MGTETRKQAEKEERRRSILDAARSLLLKKGYDAVSIRQIAQICELGTGTIYSYFSGKPEIYATLSTEVFDLLCDAFAAASCADNSPKERLRAIGRALLDFSVRHKAYYDFLDYFISSPQRIFPEEMKARIDEHGEKVLAPVIDAILEGIRSGEFAEVDAKQHALLFFGTMHGVAHFRKLRKTMLSETGFEELYRQGIESLICSLQCSR